MLQYSVHKNTNKAGNISPEEAEDRIFELIDQYFDVQNSDIDIFERVALMKKIQKEINELLPFLDKEKKKKLKHKLKNSKPKKPQSKVKPPSN